MAVRLKSLPGVRPRPRAARARKPPRREEAALSRAVRQLLAARKVWFLRCNSALLFAGGRPVRAGTPGVADYLLVIRGRAIWVELKAPRGRQRPSQVAFQAGVEAAGAKYAIVRSIDELERLLGETK